MAQPHFKGCKGHTQKGAQRKNTPKTPWIHPETPRKYLKTPWQYPDIHDFQCIFPIHLVGMLRADFREGDEDSNFSLSRVRRFTESPGPLHWIAFPVEILTKPPIHWIASPLSLKIPFFHWKVLRHIPFPKIGSDIPFAPFQHTPLLHRVPTRICSSSWGAHYRYCTASSCQAVSHHQSHMCHDDVSTYTYRCGKLAQLQTPNEPRHSGDTLGTLFGHSGAWGPKGPGEALSDTPSDTSRFRGHSRGHSGDTSGPRDSCSRPGGSQSWLLKWTISKFGSVAGRVFHIHLSQASWTGVTWPHSWSPFLAWAACLRESASTCMRQPTIAGGT